MHFEKNNMKIFLLIFGILLVSLSVIGFIIFLKKSKINLKKVNEDSFEVIKDQKKVYSKIIFNTVFTMLFIVGLCLIIYYIF
ncbi:hypothetical protein SLITO_v1c06860 [Spiroplasma litorale]|uniref:Uncharacterized protein n=1 Tax=Spiroplasma litorale TaxID=216942 RepID=A0A0K1W2C2_9MOLU|nr:hypothetical protein SLITO_v1c06860 [Spiroplasma litorale]